MISQPEPPVIEYLAALDLGAIYMAVRPGLITRVGSVKPIAMPTHYRWLHEMGLVIEWMAWCDSIAYAQWLVGSCGKYYTNVYDPVMVAVDLASAQETIERVAEAAGMRLIAHDVVVQRALDMAKRADSMMLTLQHNGYLKEFNASYRDWRIRESSKGQRVPDYRLVQTRLKACLIRASALGYKINDAVDAVRTECPWLVATEVEHG